MIRIALITLGDPTRLTGGYMYHLRVAEIAPRHGAEICFVCLPDRPFPTPALWAGWARRRLRELGAQAVLLDSIAAAFVGPSLWWRPYDVPLLGILHQPPGGIDHGPVRTALQAFLDKLAYRRARRLLVASDPLLEEMVTAGFNRQDLAVAYPGRDVAESAAEAPGDLRRGRAAAFLCVGNWVRRKDITTLLEVFATLPPDAATLHLVGDEKAEPDYEAEILARLARPDLADRVVRQGKRTRGQVSALYAAADAFVLASLKEPYGTVWGEAMAAGLPVAGWRAGNLPYLARHEQEGLFVEPGDRAGLAAQLRRLAYDHELRARLATAARARAETFPTWDQTTATILAEVRRCLTHEGQKGCPTI